jgi:predicted RNA-binding Zn-ribbon protein involved in translation (DUF1610 family)
LIILPIYAIAVWTAIAVFRRRWEGVAITLLSVLPVWWLTHLCVQHIPLKPGEPRPTWLYIIAMGYAALILVIGLVIVVQRRQARLSDCRGCGYDLAGAGGLSCPECGEAVRCTACHRSFDDPAALRCDACLTPAPRFPARETEAVGEAHLVAPFSRRLVRYLRERSGVGASASAGAEVGDGGGRGEAPGDQGQGPGDLRRAG